MGRGEKLSGVARLYRTSVSAILEMNNLKEARSVRTGMTLLVPAGPGFNLESVASSDEESSGGSRRSRKAKASSYVVRKGDTLQSIAEKFSLPVEEVARLNGLSSPDTIYPGQKLNMGGADSDDEPSGKAAHKKKEIVVYKVRRGDTLCAIASRFNVTIEEILSTNNMSSSRQIYPGQKLRIVTGNRKRAA
jgi:LysM repeat protein